MRLRGLSKHIIFDEFEEYPVITLNVFISSMLNMDLLFIPEFFPVKIYTSKIIFRQMQTYWNQRKANCLNLHSFVIMKPNVPMKVPLFLDESVEVCMFQSEDVNNNVMFMFRSDNKTTHVYAGVVREFRCLVFNDVFRDWIRDGVDDLYVDISRAMCPDERDPRELNNVIEAIEKILDSNPDHTLILNVPNIGYENFIYNLAERLRTRVSIGGITSAVFTILNKMEYFVPNTKDAKIVIVNKCFTLDLMKRAFEERNYIFIKITDKIRILDNNANQVDNVLYELNWSPLPTDFDLQLLANIVKPNRIFAIHHESYSSQLEPQVPHYLLQLCKDYAQIVDEIQKSNNFDKKVLDEIFSIKSSCGISSENASNECLMKLTQDNAISGTERAKRVLDWLNFKTLINKAPSQENVISEKQSAPSVESMEIPKTNKKIFKTKKSSSISKSLEQAQHISKSPRSAPNDEAYKNSFCIPRRSIHYLENSDSS